MFRVRIYLIMVRKSPKRGLGFYGYRIEYMDQKGQLRTKEEFAEEQDITQNQLALVAMYRAFEQLKKPCEAEVYTDSMYLRGNYAERMNIWKRSGWKTAKGEAVANREIWKALDEVTRQHLVRFAGSYDYPAKEEMTRKMMEWRKAYV